MSDVEFPGPLTLECCGHVATGASYVDGEPRTGGPEEGDEIQCYNCGAVFEIVPDGLKRIK